MPLDEKFSTSGFQKMEPPKKVKIVQNSLPVRQIPTIKPSKCSWIDGETFSTYQKCSSKITLKAQILDLKIRTFWTKKSVGARTLEMPPID